MKKETVAVQDEVRRLRQEIKKKYDELAHEENESMRLRIDKLNIQGQLQRFERGLKVIVEELKEKDKLIAQYERQIRQNNVLIQKRQKEVDLLNRKYESLLSNTNGEDYGPLEREIRVLKDKIERIDQNSAEIQQSWLKKQNELVQIEKACSKVDKGNTEALAHLAVLGKRRDRTKANLEALEKELNQYTLKESALQRELQRLGDEIHREATLGTGLVETNIQFETEVLETLKQKELSSAALQTKIQKICDEREDLADQLLEHEKSIMLFEKKLQIAREMKEALDPNYGSAELSAMRREVSRMELRLQQIVKQQQQIVKEIEFALRRRDTIRNRAIVTKRLNKDRTRSDLSKGITELSRDVKKLNVEIKQLSNGVEVNLQAVDELRTNVDQLQHILNERQITKNQLDNDIKNLEKDKIRNQALLEQVQARTTMFSGTSRKTSIKSAENYQQAIEKLQTQSQKLSELIDSLTQNFPQYADRFHLAKVRGFLE